MRLMSNMYVVYAGCCVPIIRERQEYFFLLLFHLSAQLLLYETKSGYLELGLKFGNPKDLRCKDFLLGLHNVERFAVPPAVRGLVYGVTPVFWPNLQVLCAFCG